MQKIKNLLAIGLGFLILMSSSSFVACGENSKHVHKYFETVVPSTCTAKGYTEHKCDCGDIYKDNEQELISHVGKYQCTTCQMDFGKKFKGIILEYADNFAFSIVGSNYTQEIYTNDNYEIVMSFEHDVSGLATYTVFLSYSSFNKKWTWLVELNAKSRTNTAYGEFETLSNSSISLPISYSDFNKSADLRSLMFDFFSTMVYNANQELETYNARFTMENLGLKF
mgnify:FL=1